MESDDGGTENELHDKRIVFMVNLLQKESNHSIYERPRSPEAAIGETGDKNSNIASVY